MDTITTLSIVNVQPSFPSVLQDVHDGLVPYEDVWVSCYKYPPSPSATGQPGSDPGNSSSGSPRTVHAKVQIVLDESDRAQVNLVTKEGDVGVSAGRRNSNNSFVVECPSLGIQRTTVVTPLQEYSDPDTANPRQPQRITAFDVSPDETQFAVGHLDGSVYIYPVITPRAATHSPDGEEKEPRYIAQAIPAGPGRPKNRSKPHLSGVSCLQFFPSSRVLLTAGLDFTLTILPANPPSHDPESHLQNGAVHSTRPTQEPQRLVPVRTMRSHTRPITSIGIIAPGKNVVSSSLDSTIKVWDVPSGSVVSTLIARAPVVSMTLGERAGIIDTFPHGATNGMDMDLDGPPSATQPQIQPETQTQLALCGLQNGTFEIYDFRTQSAVYHSPSSPPGLSSYGGGISAVAYNPARNLFATGTSKGMVSVYDVRTLSSSGSKPLARFRRNTAGVEDLAFLNLIDSSVGLAVATNDGLPYVAGIREGDNPIVRAELVGVDCDSVRSVKVRSGLVWCASDDAIVRRYSMHSGYS